MIMNAFVAMRRYLLHNAGILVRIAHLEKHQIETDQKIDLILDKMDANSPKLLSCKQIHLLCCFCLFLFHLYITFYVHDAKIQERCADKGHTFEEFHSKTKEL